MATPAPAPTAPGSLRRIVAASLIGTTIEWYDFFLYGSAAALVFNKLFFPNEEPWSARCCRSSPTRSASPPARSAPSSSATTGTVSAASGCSC